MKILYLTSLLLVSCALKNDETKPATTTTTTANSTATTQEAQKSTSQVKISFNDLNLKRNLIATNDFFNLSAVVTLPSTVPDELFIALSDIKEGQIQVDAISNQKLTTLSGKWDESGKINISGIRLVLPDSFNATANLTVKISDRNTDHKTFELQIELRTPPNPITGQIVSRIELSGSTPMNLQSSNLKLNLLFAMQYKNETADRVEISVNNTIQGALTRKFTNYQPQVIGACESRQLHNDRITEYNTDIFLLPISDALENNWAVQLRKEKRVKLFINPGETKLLGVYGSGNEVFNLVMDGVPTIQPRLEQLVCSCTPKTEPADYSCGTGKNSFLLGGRCPSTTKYEPIHCYLKSGDSAADEINLKVDSNLLQGSIRLGISNEVDDPETRKSQIFHNELRVF
jgi:hypothetical protein